MLLSMSSFLLVVLSQVLSVPWMLQLSSVQRHKVVGAFSLPRCNSVRSFPIGVELSLGRIFSGAHYLPQNKISDLEVSVFDLRVVVLRHEVLVSCQPLLSCCPDLVHQVKLQAYSFIILVLVTVLHSVACEPYFCWDDCLASVCQSKWCLPRRCPCRCSVCP